MKKYLTIIVIVIIILFGMYFVASRKCLSFLERARFSSSEAVEEFRKECKNPRVVLSLFK